MEGKIVAIVASLIIVLFACGYIIFHKKRKGGCIGCPHASSCTRGCGCKDKTKN